MKITAILETSLKAGGAHNQSLNALLQMKQICKGHFNFTVLAFDNETVKVLKEKDLDGILVTFSLIDKVKSKLMLAGISGNLFSEKILFPIEQKLISIGTDLVYFVGPSLLSLQLKRLNYIFTLFDLSHRDNSEFPEVREFNEFRKRELLFSQVISQSFITLTDSPMLSENASKFYGVDPAILISMPYGPSPDLDFNTNSISEIREHYKLPDSYFFYPAQFWPHKNHIRILEALFLLNNEDKIMHVVFSGGDKGNIDYIINKAKSLSLTDQIHILGLVPSSHMKSLFEGSSGVIMPTYFGPTNMPPLEAWGLGVPLIYSKHLVGQAEDAALLVDPDSSESLALSMVKITQSGVKEQLVSNGYIRLQAINEERKRSESKLLERLMIFEKRRKCWK
jgi:glycosyltransferase involved in cell wall biosynthesis